MNALFRFLFLCCVCIHVNSFVKRLIHFVPRCTISCMQNHHRLQSMHLTPNATETEEVGQVSSSLHDISDMVSSTISTSNPFVVPFSTRTLNGSFPNKIVNNSAAAFANLLKSTSGPLIATYEANEIKLRLSNLEKKVIAMASNMNRKERTVMSASGFNSISLSGNQVIGALNRAQLPLTPRTVEICSIASFFVVGMVIGRSLFDRLWLVGGVASACWASVAVHRDTRAGNMVRRTGVQVAQFIRDLQEKYNQLYVFYKTGKLAYVSSKTWEKYDQQYAITQKLNAWKRLAMQRASEFNSTFDTSRVRLQDQFSDLLKVLRTPAKPKHEPTRYKKWAFRAATYGKKGVSRTVGIGKGFLTGTSTYGKRVLSSVRNTWNRFRNSGLAQDTVKAGAVQTVGQIQHKALTNVPPSAVPTIGLLSILTTGVQRVVQSYGRSDSASKAKAGSNKSGFNSWFSTQKEDDRNSINSTLAVSNDRMVILLLSCIVLLELAHMFILVR